MFTLIIRTIITAQMILIGGEGPTYTTNGSQIDIPELTVYCQDAAAGLHPLTSYCLTHWCCETTTNT